MHMQRDKTEQERANVDLEKALTEIKRSEIELRTIVDALPAHAWASRADRHNIYCNQQWLDYSGITQEGTRSWTYRDTIHPDDLEPFVKKWNELSANGATVEAEARFRRYDGEYRWFLVRALPVRDEHGNTIKWFGTNTDIDDRKKAEALLAGENMILEMVATGKPLPTILEELCYLVDNIQANSMSSVLLVDSANCLRTGAAPRFPKDFISLVDGLKIGPSVGSCGTAAYRKEQVIVADIENDPLWADYRELALKYGLRAGWSSPIFSSDRRVLGVFGIYWDKPHTPAQSHLGLIDQITHLASVAIERHRTQEAISATKARFEGILEIADDAIVSIDSDRNVLLFNRGAQKAFGYAESEILGQSISLLLPLEEFVCSGGDDDNRSPQRREVTGRRKDGSEFPAEASISMLDLADETVFTIILRDITERKQTAEALRVSERFARGQADTLTRTLDELTKEPIFDRIAEHVLRALNCHLDAVSSGVWLKNGNSGLMDFEFALERGVLRSKSDAELAALSPSVPLQTVCPCPEIFITGKPAVLTDIRASPAFSSRSYFLNQGVITMLMIPMFVAGEAAGVIGVRFDRMREFRPEELELAQALANQAMLAMQLWQLSEKNRRSAILGERNRLAREVHDTLAQGFTGIIVQLEAAGEAMAKSEPSKVSRHFERASALARESLQEARRSVRALRPQALEETNLSMALKNLFVKMTLDTPVMAKLTVDGEPKPLPQEWENNMLRIGQELLTNALRHSQATEVYGRLSFDSARTSLHFCDNGIGFDPEGDHEGFGLQGIRERAESMGGRFAIQSEKGRGTSISIILPIDSTTHSHERIN